MKFAIKRLAISPQTNVGWWRTAAAPLQPELLETRQHDRRRGRGRQAQRQQRHQRPRGRGVVGGLSGPATPSMAPWPNSSGCWSSFGGMDRKVPISRPARRHGADGKADHGAAQPRLPRPRPVLALIQIEPLTAVTSSSTCTRWPAMNSASPTANMAATMVVTSIPSSSSGTPNDSRACPVNWSMPTQAAGQPQKQRGQPAQRRESAEGGRDGDKGQHHQPGISRAGQVISATLTMC